MLLCCVTEECWLLWCSYVGYELLPCWTEFGEDEDINLYEGEGSAKSAEHDEIKGDKRR